MRATGGLLLRASLLRHSALPIGLGLPVNDCQGSACGAQTLADFYMVQTPLDEGVAPSDGPSTDATSRHRGAPDPQQELPAEPCKAPGREDSVEAALAAERPREASASGALDAVIPPACNEPQTGPLPAEDDEQKQEVVDTALRERNGEQHSTRARPPVSKGADCGAAMPRKGQSIPPAPGADSDAAASGVQPFEISREPGSAAANNTEADRDWNICHVSLAVHALHTCESPLGDAHSVNRSIVSE